MAETPDTWLLSARLADLAGRLGTAPDDVEREALWKEADAFLAAAGAEEDADLALPVWERQLDALRALVAAWDAGRAPLPEWDKGVLRRAFKAYKKRLKLARLDDESTAGANPLSAGRTSSIVGIRPPDAYPPEVWARLVAQGKLRDAGSGLYELCTV